MIVRHMSTPVTTWPVREDVFSNFRSRFDVRCYRDSFIQVVYRAFQLGYQVSGEKVEAEIKAGKLALSHEPTAGYRCRFV